MRARGIVTVVQMLGPIPQPPAPGSPHNRLRSVRSDRRAAAAVAISHAEDAVDLGLREGAVRRGGRDHELPVELDLVEDQRILQT
jgi:hypothetical protein